MATITLNKVRVAKNGMTAYRTSTKRLAGTVHFDAKMFPSGGPETLVITAEGIQEPIPDAPKPAKTEAPATETATTAQTEASTEAVGSI